MAAKVQRTSGRRAVLVVLCVLAMGNVSDGMVVCVAGPGHVAIEPAGHDHCTGEAAHGETAGHAVACLYERSTNGGCTPCVDIPLVLGAFDRRSASATLKSGLPTPAPCAESPAGPTDLTTPLQPFTPYPLLTLHTPLAGIVLQV